MNQRKITISSAIICLIALIAAVFYAFQTGGDGYYLGWSDGILIACEEGCPSLNQKDFDLAQSLGAEQSEFRKDLVLNWAAFLSAISVAVISALTSLVATIRSPSERSSNG